MPWNLQNLPTLVGNFQSPTTTAASGGTPSDYATNQVAPVSAAGTLPHPLPHYSTHPYASSPHSSAPASYHQSELGIWGGHGSTAATNLGMHSGQSSSPLPGITAAAMAVAAAVSDGTSGANVVTSVGGNYKMEPEMTSMYYHPQVNVSFRKSYFGFNFILFI